MKIRRLGAIIGALALVFTVAGVAFADAPSADTIAVASNVGPVVTVDGTWTWSRCDPANNNDFDNNEFAHRYVGWAISWGEASYTDNALWNYFMGDSVTGNVVQGSYGNCTAATGTWGDISHTYAADGTYNICVVLYDVKKDGPATGGRSTVAGGADRNKDNSIEEQDTQTPTETCTQVEVVVEAATATATPPITATTAPGNPDGNTLPLIVMMGVIGALGLAFLRPLSRRSR